MSDDREMEIEVLRGEVLRREEQIQQLRADLDVERYERKRAEAALAAVQAQLAPKAEWCRRCQTVHAAGAHTRPEPIQASVETALGVESEPSGEGLAERDGDE